jgi:hypothetical protein
VLENTDHLFWLFDQEAPCNLPKRLVAKVATTKGCFSSSFCFINQRQAYIISRLVAMNTTASRHWLKQDTSVSVPDEGAPAVVVRRVSGTIAIVERSYNGFSVVSS